MRGFTAAERAQSAKLLTHHQVMGPFVKQTFTKRSFRIISSSLLPALGVAAAATFASPAQAVPLRAIFTGNISDRGEDFFPTGLSPSDTFSWAVVFNPGFTTPATQTSDLFKWLQTGPSSEPLFTPETLTSPFNTGISGSAYNSIGTPPTDGGGDYLQLNNFNKTFTLQTGRTPSGLNLEVDGSPIGLTNLFISGTMPGLQAGTSSNLYAFFTEAVGPSGQYSCSTANLGCNGNGSIELAEGNYEFVLTSITLEVPGPLGIAGLAPLLAYSRKLRLRLKGSRAT